MQFSTFFPKTHWGRPRCSVSVGPGDTPDFPRTPIGIGGIISTQITPPIASRGWTADRLAALDPWWAEICRDIRGDAVSPYNDAVQTLWANDPTNHLRLSWAGQYFGIPYNVVRGDQAMANVHIVGVNPGHQASQVPFPRDIYVENWPKRCGRCPSITHGATTLTGTGFTQVGSQGEPPIMVGGEYRVGGGNWASWQPYSFIVASVDSDTQLTLAAPYEGPTYSTDFMGPYGPFNHAYSTLTDGADHHIIAVQRDESTGFPATLYEMYMYGTLSNGSPDDGATWNCGSAAAWDLIAGTQIPDGFGASTAAGIPMWPFLVNYDEVSTGEIRHALRGIVGTAMEAHGCVWPAKQSNIGNSTIDYTTGKMCLGSRVRLKDSWYTANISNFSMTNQVILKALWKYGAINADWTAPGWSYWLDGCNDARWDEADLARLSQIPLTAFELIGTQGPQCTLTGPATLTRGVQATFTLTYEFDSQNIYDHPFYGTCTVNGGPGPDITGYTRVNNDNWPVTFKLTPNVSGTYVIHANGGHLCCWIPAPDLVYTVS